MENLERFGGKTFLWKTEKYFMREFYVIYLPPKLTKFPNFKWYLPKQMPKFYMIIARKIFFRNFVPPVCYAYENFKNLI